MDRWMEGRMKGRQKDEEREGGGAQTLSLAQFRHNSKFINSDCPFLFFFLFLFSSLLLHSSVFIHFTQLHTPSTHEPIMDAKKPLKSALKKTGTSASASSASAQASAKRKHTPTVSTKTTASEGNKRVKGNNNDKKSKPNNAKGSNAKNNNNNTKPKQQQQKQKKSVTIKTPNHTGKKGGPVTAGSAPAKKVAPKPKKVEVIPEGSTFEDFRVVAGTYENVLYGVDAYWNEVRF